MISFQNVTKKFCHDNGNFLALRDITFDVPKGEITGIIGKSGAGKSTLLRCVNGLEFADSGKIIVDQASIADLSGKNLRDLRKKTAMVFQHFNLLSSKTVFENIAFPLYLNGEKKTEVEQKVNRLLALTELEPYRNKFPSQLSGGQKQRVAVARALICDPDVLLCDEATSALDPQNTHSILSLLDKINRSLGKTILLVTHEMDVIKSICHRVILLDRGSLVESSDAVDFFLNPKTKLSQDFVRSNMETEIIEVLRKKEAHARGSLLKVILHLEKFGQGFFDSFLTHQIAPNVIYSKVEFIRETRIGFFLFEINAPEERFTQFLAHLKASQINYEIVPHAV